MSIETALGELVQRREWILEHKSYAYCLFPIYVNEFNITSNGLMSTHEYIDRLETFGLNNGPPYSILVLSSSTLRLIAKFEYDTSLFRHQIYGRTQAIDYITAVISYSDVVSDPL